LSEGDAYFRRCGWHPNSASSKKTVSRFIVRSYAENQEKVRAEALHRAEEWRRMLDAGEVGSQAEIARSECLPPKVVSRALARLKP
jgi:hypothetical protein